MTRDCQQTSTKGPVDLNCVHKKKNTYVYEHYIYFQIIHRAIASRVETKQELEAQVIEENTDVWELCPSLFALDVEDKHGAVGGACNTRVPCY